MTFLVLVWPLLACCKRLENELLWGERRFPEVVTDAHVYADGASACIAGLYSSS